MITPALTHPIYSEIKLKHAKEKAEIMQIDHVIMKIVKRWQKR